MRNFKESPVVFVADVLEHAQGGDAVEGPDNVTVILQTDFYRQALARLLSQLHLLPRKGDTDDPRAVFFGRKPGQASPAAADVKHGHSRLKSKFAANEI